MKQKFIKADKLYQANENIEILIEKIIDLHKELNHIYCPYAGKEDRGSICEFFEDCDNCKHYFYVGYKRDLIEEYCVNA